MEGLPSHTDVVEDEVVVVVTEVVVAEEGPDLDRQGGGVIQGADLLVVPEVDLVPDPEAAVPEEMQAEVDHGHMNKMVGQMLLTDRINQQQIILNSHLSTESNLFNWQQLKKVL